MRCAHCDRLILAREPYTLLVLTTGNGNAPANQISVAMHQACKKAYFEAHKLSEFDKVLG